MDTSVADTRRGIVTPGVVAASVLLREGRPDWLRQWGEFAAGVRFDELPREVVDRARLVLLDTVGVIASGMQEPEMRALARRLAGRRATAASEAAVIGAGLRLSSPDAAFLNGTAGTMLELDEGNQYARGHPGIHVIPAALAAALEAGASGSELLTAIVLGYEIGSRVGIASKLRVTMHPHGTWGTIGAAVAAARLGGADPAALAETISMASSLGLSTSRRTMLEGGTVRNTYAGFSNRLGMTAWDLAASGFLGEADGVGTVYGTVIAEDFRPEEMTAGLGTRWEIARNYFKRHAACRYTHGALDALAAITARIGKVDADSVERVEVDTYVWAAQLDHPAPRNMLAAKFSLPFAIATTLVNGAATVPAFRETALHEEAARALAGRVVVREDPALTAQLPGLRPARVRLILRDGAEHRAEVLTNRGDIEDPYSPAEVTAKFQELAAPVWGEAHPGRIAEAVMAIEHAADLKALDALLAGAGRG
jgi:2-methylcitrate dehydratase PrpD